MQHQNKRKAVDQGCADAESAERAISSYPKRNLEKLYCPAITYLCAIGALPSSNSCSSGGHHVASSKSKPCVPCAYKICNFDIGKSKFMIYA